ncbi:MAG: hypothetical protein U0W24_24295 [Bacteroidales bacterium]
MIKRSILLTILILSVLSCGKEKLELQWKVAPEEVLIYKIQMETIDTLSSVPEDAMSSLVKMVAKMYGDSVNVPVNSEDIYQGLISSINSLSYFAILRQGVENEMKIQFITRANKQYAREKYLDIFNKFIRKAVFKGSLLNNGELYNDEGQEVFDPKINILFELPEKPVAVGDVWPLRIKFTDQKIDKENARDTLNQVKFTELLVENGDSIAVLEYKLQGPENVGRALNYVGKGKFNMNKGKWDSYTGILTQRVSGIVSMKQVQKIKLTEISVEKYKNLIKEAQKVDVLDVDYDKPEIKDQEIAPENEKETNKTTEKIKVQTSHKSDCPQVYRVQILATQQPVKDGAKEFKNCKYRVDQLVMPTTEKFRYKYTVGKECTQEKAKVLLSEIKKSGFPNAYIIKTSGDL